MTEWPEELVKKGLLTPAEIQERIARWQPPALHDQYPFPIREDTGMRDLRMRETEVRVPRTRQADMTLGDRPGSKGAKADVLGPACKECGLSAAYEVREPDRMAYACPLHLFGTIAAYLLGNNVVTVSLINMNADNAERRELVEQAVWT